MPGGTITGVKARIDWSYYPAAALLHYTVTKGTAGWRVSATVVASDSFKLSQAPLVFVAPHAKGEWRWPITQWSIEGGRLTAALGAPLP